MLVTALRILLVLVLAFVIASKGSAEIYKWVDAEGNVHFGDCPPPDCESEEIRIAPAPSDRAIQEAQGRVKRLQEYEKKIRDDRKEEAKQAAKPVVSYPKDAECFVPLADSWGGRIADTREQVSRTPLKDAELRQVKNVLRSVEGLWRGTLEDVICVRPDATPPTKSYHYDFRFDARWQSDQIFGTEADLVGKETGVTLRQFFWFLLSREGLRFRSATTDIWFKLDQPANNVETLTIGSDSLMFFWRRGGVVRKANVFELRKAGRGFTINEFFYVQGTLTGKRVWEISR